MLKATTRRGPGSARVILRGTLDESAETTLTPLLAPLAGREIVFDCGGLEAVNSVGFRAWLRFLAALGAEAPFTLERCSGAFLDYVGMLPTTSFASRIASVLVPYRCGDCRRGVETLLDTDAHDAEDEFPEMLCPKCNGLMTCEVDASDYLAFLRHR